MATTRWIDNEITLLDEAINRLLQIPEDDINHETTIYSKWQVNKRFDENQQITFNGRSITYNYINFSYNKILPGNQPIDDRTTPNDGSIICYFNGTSVNYIINKHSDAQKILRKMLHYSGKNEISRNSFDISSDFFIWMISKVYLGENIIETESKSLKDLSLESIKGFKGDTEDSLTKVSASGESVMNIISTLSFLLESKRLNQIKINLQYGNHDNIELQLINNGAISTEVKEYQGEFEEDERVCLQAKLYLLIYIEIIPILMQAYRIDIENEEWTINKNIEFLREVAADLQKKVNLRISSLE